jgi:hypothetical protein
MARRSASARPSFGLPLMKLKSARAGTEESAGEARQRLRSWLVPGNGIAPFLPVGRHLETLPDVHCELQRVAGVGCSWGDPGGIADGMVRSGDDADLEEV